MIFTINFPEYFFIAEIVIQSLRFLLEKIYSLALTNKYFFAKRLNFLYTRTNYNSSRKRATGVPGLAPQLPIKGMLCS